MNQKNLSPGVGPVSKVLSQIAQLECQFKGPLLVDDQVEHFEDLILLNDRYFYEHKRVWVKEFKCFYYIDSGDGTDLLNWKRAKARLLFEPWNNEEYYQQGDVCHFFGKIYIAEIDIEPGHNPAQFPEYWDVITGEIETYRYVFENAAQVRVFTEIRNPLFEIIIGDFVMDPGTGSIVTDPVTGLAMLENQEVVSAYVYQDESVLNDDRGTPYIIAFFADEEPIELVSGCINIK
jgi:hypothetical protein